MHSRPVIAIVFWRLRRLCDINIKNAGVGRRTFGPGVWEAVKKKADRAPQGHSVALLPAREEAGQISRRMPMGDLIDRFW